MKRIIPILMTVLMFAMLTACGSNSQPGTSSAPAATDTPDAVQEEEESTDTPDAVQEETTDLTADAASEEPETMTEGTTEETAEDSSLSSEEASTAVTEAETAAHSDVLVAFFSATGTTKGVAERIASVTGGNLSVLRKSRMIRACALRSAAETSPLRASQLSTLVFPSGGARSLASWIHLLRSTILKASR